MRFSPLALLCAVFIGALPARSSDYAVVINEFHYHPADDTQEGEFIELYNRGSQPVDLSGWVFTRGVDFTFPGGTLIEGRGYLVVARDRSTIIPRYGLDPDHVTGDYTGGLENNGETVELRDAAGHLIASVTYTDGDPWPSDADGMGPSVERIDPLRDETDPESWAPSIVIGGTPGERNSVYIEPTSPDEVTLIGPASVYRYFRGTQEPSGGTTDWTTLGFSDQEWEMGEAGFGYSDDDDRTVLDDMRDSYTTVYIRRIFHVDDPGEVSGLTLSIDYDDAFIVYINGTRIARSEFAPSGDPPYDATTGGRHHEITGGESFDLGAALSVLVAGDNVLAIQGLNALIDSGDFSLNPQRLTATIPEDPTVRFVRAGSTWRFFRGTAEPSGGNTNWAGVTFVDEDWEEGQTAIGYGESGIATPLDDMQGSYISVYLRKEFTVQNPALVRSLTLIVDYDDGFIAFLNGSELHRENADDPGTFLPYDQGASGDHESEGNVTFPVDFAIPYLLPGKNVLAVQALNVTQGSTDLVIHPQLEGTFEPPSPGVRPPRNVAINEIFCGRLQEGWVELYNRTPDAIDLSGWILELYPPIPGPYIFPAGSSIEGNGFTVVREADLLFPLDDLLTVLCLATPDGRFVDGFNPRTTTGSRSSGLWPDGVADRYVLSRPTFGAPNEVTLRTQVVINEIMYHSPDGEGEYIELHNRSGAPVPLTGWRFTRGIDFEFEGGSIPPNGYVVVARNPDVAKQLYSLTEVYGPWIGKLKNSAETLLLRDEFKNPVDQVRYADDGLWPPEADGDGPSIELLNPKMHNLRGPAWGASDGPGTPGAENSRYTADLAPIVTDVEHTPIVPRSFEAVLVTATVSDETGVTGVTLLYQPDETPGPETPVPMVDDGVGDNGVAGDGIYGGTIPRHDDGVIVRFRIRAEDGTGHTTTAPTQGFNETVPEPWRFLYPVDDRSHPEDPPLFRIVMTEANRDELFTRGNLVDDLLDVTFIDGRKAYYNRGIRFRGQSSRNYVPHSYRVQFDHDRDYHDKEGMNLNAYHPHLQWAGLDFLRRCDAIAPIGTFRTLTLNRTFYPRYVWVEAVDDEFLERVFGNAAGNLYRGDRDADLEFRGEDFDPYRPHYIKHTKEEEDDYSDIVELCRTFDPDTTPRSEFPMEVERWIDVDQWTRYFAVYAVLGSIEGAIVRDTGDDYYLYHIPPDDLTPEELAAHPNGYFAIVPWDLDEVYTEEDQRLFRPTLPTVSRFLRHPRYAARYWCYVQDFMEYQFAIEAANERLDRLTGIASQANETSMRNYIPERHAYVNPRIPRDLTVNAPEGTPSCAGRAFTVPDGPVALEGDAPGCGTTWVEVNGQEADYDPVNGEWQHELEMAGAFLAIEVIAIDYNGHEVARITSSLMRAGGFSELSGTISTSRTLTAGDPWRVIDDVIVAAGVTLTVEPGANILFDEGAFMTVRGTMRAEGSGADPVFFGLSPCAESWQGLQAEGGQSRVILSHADLRGATAGISATGGARVEIRDSNLSDHGAAIVATDSSVTIENVRIRDGSGDGISVSGGSLGISGATLYRLDGNAIRLEGSGSHSLDRVLIHDSGGAGVALSDGVTASISHSTIYNSATGIHLFDGSQGGGVTDADSLIVWACLESIIIDGPGVLSVSHSDIDGSDLYPGVGNIDAYPVFVSPPRGDFRLRAGSPALGTGKDGGDMGAIPNGYFIRGDANGNDHVGLEDVAAIVNYLFRRGPIQACAPADTNDNGRITIGDAIYILVFAFRDSNHKPPMPFPDLGIDPTPGDFPCMR